MCSRTNEQLKKIVCVHAHQFMSLLSSVSEIPQFNIYIYIYIQFSNKDNNQIKIQKQILLSIGDISFLHINISDIKLFFDRYLY